MRNENGKVRKIVAYQDGHGEDCEVAIRRLGGTVYKRLSIANALVCSLPDNDSVVASLSKLPCIARVEDDITIRSLNKKSVGP